jgi:competence protein ComEC
MASMFQKQEMGHARLALASGMTSAPNSGNLHSAYRHPGPFAALLGWVLGTMLQLQQSARWPAWAYALLALPRGLLVAALWLRRGLQLPGARRAMLWFVAAAGLALACTGMRCVFYESQSLAPELEGRDVLVSGVVTDMPQRNEAGLRFTLVVNSATLDGALVQIPKRMDVGW